MKRAMVLAVVLGVVAAPAALGALSPTHDQAAVASWWVGRAPAAALPFTFFFTHYELLGNPSNPVGVRYHSSGKPFATATGGSRITVTGRGGWDPARGRATGGGRYTISNPAGAVTRRGTWRVTGFTSFKKLPGWWGIPGFKEEGWQGPPGSSSFSGFLTLRVNLENLGAGVLSAWCLMPTTPKPKGHVGDGISLTGRNFKFTGFEEQEMGFQGMMSPGAMTMSPGGAMSLEGVMFYAA